MIENIWIYASLLFSICSFLPLVGSKHWFFRLFDFLRIQLTVILVLLLICALFIELKGALLLITLALLIISIVYQLIIILPYLPLKKDKSTSPENKVTVLSVNVQQDNKQFESLIELVKRIQPDVLLTMETNQEWENGIKEIEKDFDHVIRVPKENKYGMHLYTKLKLKEHDVHFLISEEHPSILARMVDSEDNEFLFWGIHPPPPSPTEKPTSKQKDGELMKVAKMSLKFKLPTVISGDFNNVTWSRTSKMFSKVSQLKDARINRGIFSTFPAYSRILGFPIDLLFHSESVSINTMQILEPIGSDHLPLLFTFSILRQREQVGRMDAELKEEVNEIIEEGKQAAKDENE